MKYAQLKVLLITYNWPILWTESNVLNLFSYETFLLRYGEFLLRLIGSAMFGVTFSLVTRVGLPWFLEH